MVLSAPFQICRSSLARRSSGAFPRSFLDWRWRLLIQPVPSAAFRSNTTSDQNDTSKAQSTTAASKERPGLVEGVLQWMPNMPTDSSMLENDPEFHTTSLDWTQRIHRLIDDGKIQEANATLQKAVQILEKRGDHDQWIRTERLEMLDVWVEHQVGLYHQLVDHVKSDAESRPTRSSLDEKRKIASERKVLVREIAAAAENAHTLLERVEPFLGARPAAVGESSTDATPSRTSVDPVLTAACHTVLLAWTRTVRADQQLRRHRVVRGAPQRAQFLHDRMQLSLATTTSFPPSVESYKHLLEVWAYSGEHLRAAAAHRVFRDRVAQTKWDTPIDLETFRLIMTAFALSEERRSAYQATYFLKKMMMLQESSGDETSGTPGVTVDDYRVVLEAWTRSEEKAAPYKASDLMKYLEDSETAASPDVACYRCLLETIARKSEQTSLGDLADETLQKMREAYMVPDSLCFTYAITTWKNATLNTEATVAEKETSVRRTLDLLGEMDVAHNQSTSLDVLVSTQNVNDALEVLSLSDNPRRTELANTLLSRMEAEIPARNFRLMPDSASYKFAICIWKSVWSETRVEEAKSILQRMIDRFDAVSRKSGRRNDPVTVFNEFIQVCGTQRVATAIEGLAVLQEAINAVQQIRQFSGKLVPNATTYAVLLRACVNVLDDTVQRSTLVKKIFAQCCVEGMVDEEVLQSLKNAISSEQYAELVIARSEEIDGVQLVPEAWSARALRGSTITADGRRTVPLGIDGRLTFTRGMLEFQMRRLRDKRNQRLLRGGRLQTTIRGAGKSWTLY